MFFISPIKSIDDLLSINILPSNLSRLGLSSRLPLIFILDLILLKPISEIIIESLSRSVIISASNLIFSLKSTSPKNLIFWLKLLLWLRSNTNLLLLNPIIPLKRSLSIISMDWNEESNLIILFNDGLNWSISRFKFILFGSL